MSHYHHAEPTLDLSVVVPIYNERDNIAPLVEDIVRDVAVRLNADERIVAYTVEAENFESIHNHSAYAHIASNHLVGEPHLNS